MLVRVFWKNKNDSKAVRPFSGYVKALDLLDAERIVSESLDTRLYYVVGSIEVQEHQITPQSITLNFRNFAWERGV